MSHRERRRLRVDDLPQSLAEACDELEKDDVMQEALGEYIAQQFLAAKRAEWEAYNQQVTAWELDRYLARY
jgi:glutamine synthetase